MRYNLMQEILLETKKEISNDEETTHREETTIINVQGPNNRPQHAGRKPEN